VRNVREHKEGGFPSDLQKTEIPNAPINFANFPGSAKFCPWTGRNSGFLPMPNLRIYPDFPKNKGGVLHATHLLVKGYKFVVKVY